MGFGLRIDLNDGRKAMEITSGLRAPSFVTSTSMGSARDGNVVGISRNPGTQLGCIIADPIYINNFDSSGYPLPGIYIWNGISDNGGSVTYNMSVINGTMNNPWWPASTVYEIFPASSVLSGFGMLIADSVDFTTFTNVHKMYSCVWSGRVTISGQWTMPVGGIPFAKWDSPSSSLSFDGGRTLICRDTNYGGRDDLGATIEADVAIFDVVPVTPGPGFNIYNTNGQCTFSTSRKPFILKKFITISDGWQDCGGLIQVQRCGVFTNKVDGYQNLRWKGIKMHNGQVLSDRNQVQGNYNQPRGGIYYNSNISTPIPVIPDMY